MIDFIEETNEFGDRFVVLSENFPEHWVQDIVRFKKGWNVFFPRLGAGVSENISEDQVDPNELSRRATEEVNTQTEFLRYLEEQDINVSVVIG